MTIMKKIIGICNETWKNAIAFNAFLPTGMIPYTCYEVK